MYFKHLLKFSCNGSDEDIARIMKGIEVTLKQFGCFEAGVTSNIEIFVNDNRKENN